jgi:hypothetical protein
VRKARLWNSVQSQKIEKPNKENTAFSLPYWSKGVKNSLSVFLFAYKSKHFFED